MGCNTWGCVVSLKPVTIRKPQDIPHRQLPDYIRLATCCQVTDLNALKRELKLAGIDPRNPPWRINA
jgi:hypothetical protein